MAHHRTTSTKDHSSRPGPLVVAAPWRDDVRPEHVHRHDPADIFPQAWRVSGTDRFQVHVRWPARHRFYVVPGAGHDPLLAAETMRQTAMLLAHTEYHAPLTDRFIMQTMEWDCRPAFDVPVARPELLRVDVEVHDVRRRGAALSSLGIETTFVRDGVPVARAGGTLGCLTERAYTRIRAGRTAVAPVPMPPMPPATVGRTDERDVVLSATGRPGHFLLRVDPSHPTLFSRPNDHVPGMVLVEAARQSAVAVHPVGQPAPAAGRVDFHRYAELDEPCEVEAYPDPAGGIRVEGRQAAGLVFAALLSPAR